MIIVGKTIKNPKIKSTVTYKDVITDEEGWADPQKFLPRECEMVKLKTECGKTINGWHFSNVWDGLHLRPHHKIIAWNRKKYVALEKENDMAD